MELFWMVFVTVNCKKLCYLGVRIDSHNLEYNIMASINVIMQNDVDCFRELEIREYFEAEEEIGITSPFDVSSMENPHHISVVESQ